MKRLSLTVAISASALLQTAPLAAAAATSHPPLVSVAATRCTDCHGELVKDRVAVHAPAADDCTTCHQIEIDGAETRVALSEAEPALCLLCHGELESAVAGELASPHFPVTDSCLTCHDPHGADQARLLVAPQVELCTSCHDRGDLEAGHGGQLAAATACTSCHRAHGSANPRLLAGGNLHPPFEGGSCDACHRPPFAQRVRLRAGGEKVCTACHGDIGEAAARGSRHAALAGERGSPGCISCHNPHMSDRPRLLLEAGPELCGRCHGEIVSAAQAPTGHFPAADDCLTCHRPHRAPEVKLLEETPPGLCLTCHEVADLRTAHLGAEPASLACTGCHTPHGDGNPKLLAAHLHPPVLDGCDTCHEGAWNRQLEDGESALCLLCHDDIGELAAAAKVPHAALELGRCVDCHNPHASPQERLVKGPGAGPCGECHDDKLPAAGERAHGVIDLVGCRACHEPHGGDNPKLLRRTGSELCLSCHVAGAVAIDDAAQSATLLDRFTVPAGRVRAMVTLRLSTDGRRGHPVAGHRVLGMPTEDEAARVETTYREELTCLSCHDPHKGRYRLLRWNASAPFEACLHCHPK